MEKRDEARTQKAIDSVVSGDVEGLRWFLKRSGNILIQDTEFRNFAHISCIQNHPSMLQYVLQQGASLNGRDVLGRSPLHLAILEGHTDCVDILLNTPGLDINAADNEGWTSLHLASGLGLLQEATAILEHGADIESKTVGGVTPLHWACAKGRRGMAEMLIEKGASCKATDALGNTSLHMAASVESPGTVEALLEAGSDVNAQNSDGETPLHAACIAGTSSSVSVLLSAGATKSSPRNDGATPSSLATNPLVVKLLDKFPERK